MAWFDVIGSLGVGMIILTYVLLQTERLRSDKVLYSMLNAAGALLILISLYFSFNLPSFVVEVFWLFISLYGVLRNSIRQRPKHSLEVSERLGSKE